MILKARHQSWWSTKITTIEGWSDTAQYNSNFGTYIPRSWQFKVMTMDFLKNSEKICSISVWMTLLSFFWQDASDYHCGKQALPHYRSLRMECNRLTALERIPSAEMPCVEGIYSIKVALDLHLAPATWNSPLAWPRRPLEAKHVSRGFDPWWGVGNTPTLSTNQDFIDQFLSLSQEKSGLEIFPHFPLLKLSCFIQFFWKSSFSVPPSHLMNQKAKPNHLKQLPLTTLIWKQLLLSLCGRTPTSIISRKPSSHT